MQAELGDAHAAAVAQILALVRQRTGLDFSRYRPATVQRRIANRMISLGMASLEAYLERLHSSADEPQLLLDRITIKVSRFYRNPAAFDRLRSELIPQLCREVNGGPRRAPLRIWSAGCGNGEEAYTLAMLLSEAGYEGVVEATDVDPMALAAARRATYPIEAAQDLPLELAARYLRPIDDDGRMRVEVRPELRRRVRFTRHDLLFASVPGWTGFDLVSCRNVLIYLQNEGRNEVFGTLCRAVRPGGLLFLGEAEWPPEAIAASLEVVAQGARIFRAMEGQPA